MRRAALLFVLLLGACAQPPEPRVVDVSGREKGRVLFNDPRFSPSVFNALSCATCHAVADAGTWLPSGYDLRGVTLRPRTWGGNERDLLSAVNVCLVYFMRGQPLTRDDAQGKALYEYLQSLAGGDSLPRPMTVVRNPVDVPRGDVGRGAAVYENACRSCHGARDTGEGRITPLASILPNVKDEYPALFPGIPPAVVFVEKVRHGQFFGVGGNMPFFSTEALGDEDLGALLAWLGL
jgi:thiosulfate dehydrogenase